MSILPWLIQRLADRYHAKAGNLQAYKARYSDAIDTILTMVEAGKKPELKVLKNLQPVLFDKPDWIDRDLVSTRTAHPFQADLRPFVANLKETRDKGIWQGFTVFQTVQPTQWSRLAKRTHQLILQKFTLPSQQVEAPAIGPISIYGLISLNNILCLYARLLSSRISSIPIVGPRMVRYDVQNKALEHAIQTIFVRMANQPYTIGDLFFLESLVPFIAEFQDDHLAIPNLRRLVHLSPWTILSRIEDDDIWRTLTPDDLAGISRIFSMDDLGLPVFGALMQRWVDVLVLAGEDRRGLIFERINGIMKHLLDISSNQFIEDDRTKRNNNIRCILIFIRFLMRSWPDDQTKNEAFGLTEKKEEKKSDFWRTGFLQITFWLDEARKDLDEVIWRPWFPLSEEKMLIRCMILTNSKARDIR